MGQAGIKVQLSLREIYEKLCPKCKKKVREMIREKITEEMISSVIEG